MKLRYLKKAALSGIILSLGLSLAVHANIMDSRDKDVQVVANTYAWFNQISSSERQIFTVKDVARHFDGNAKMITNGKLVCEGIQGHFDHFKELNVHYASLQVDVNSIDYRKSGDRIYLHYQIKGKDIQDQPVTIDVMGYMVIKNHKIALFNEVISHDKA